MGGTYDNFAGPDVVALGFGGFVLTDVEGGELGEDGGDEGEEEEDGKVVDEQHGGGMFRNGEVADLRWKEERLFQKDSRMGEVGGLRGFESRVSRTGAAL